MMRLDNTETAWPEFINNFQTAYMLLCMQQLWIWIKYEKITLSVGFAQILFCIKIFNFCSYYVASHTCNQDYDITSVITFIYNLHFTSYFTIHTYFFWKIIQSINHWSDNEMIFLIINIYLYTIYTDWQKKKKNTGATI